MLTQIKETALSLLFPPVCRTCAATLPLSSGAGVCPKCASEIKPLRAPHCRTCGRTVSQAGNICSECKDRTFHFDAAYAAAVYEGPMKDILQVYKFEKQRSLRNFLTDLLRAFFEKHLADMRFDAVAAVPLDSKRSLERGFNQSALLSKALSKKIGLPEMSGKIKRKPSAIPQSLLGKTERKENVKNAFYVSHGGAFKGLNILLVDDILTTGQTASECARILKKDGEARSVTVLACARGV